MEHTYKGNSEGAGVTDRAAYFFYRGLERRRRAGQFQRLSRLKKREVLSAESVTLKPLIQRECIFIHIPKCAGISIASSLYGCYGAGHVPFSHWPLVLSLKELRRFYKFSVVRNPWDRVYSAYKFLSRGGMNEADAKFGNTVLVEYSGFEDFVLNWVTKDNVSSQIHFYPQMYFITPSKLMRRFNVTLDYIARFEQIESDFAVVCEALGESSIELVRRNPSTSSDYREAYTGRMIDQVAEVYRKDIECLKYKFS